MKFLLALLVSVLLVGLNSGTAFPRSEKAPGEISPLLNEGDTLLYLSPEDLNGDGLSDYLLILEKSGGADLGNLRELVIVIRQKDHSLRIVKRNSKIVMCSKCGGGWGDPFSEDNVVTDTKTFSVQNYGGGGIRWSQNYKFNYSRTDETWQLVEATVSTFNTNDLEDEETVYKPPKDFGKIDIADFDPETFLQR